MQQPDHALPVSSSSASPRRSQRSALWLRAVVGLARVEIRGRMPLGIGVLALSVVGIGLARWLMAARFPQEESAYAALLLSVTLTAALPLVAELFEADWRKGTATALRPTPVTWGASLTAKLLAGALLILGLRVGIGLADFAMLGFAPATGGNISPRAVSFPGTSVLFGWVGITSTMITAIVFRHALAATLLGALMSTLPVALLFASGSSLTGGALDLGPTAFCLAVTATFLLCSFRLRGAGSRSMFKRASVVGAGLFGLIAVPYAAAITARNTAPALDFNDPAADVDHLVSVTPNGKTLLLYMNHAGLLGVPRQSTWAVELASGTARALPQGTEALHPLMPLPHPCFSVVSSFDGKKIVGAAGSSPSTYEFFMVDLATGAVSEIDSPTHNRITYHCGWTFERIDSGVAEHDAFLGASHPSFKSITLTSKRAPKVPAQAPARLFYISSDRSLRCYDAESGETTRVPVVAPEGSFLRVSPDGRWLQMSGQGFRTLIEVETGRTRDVDGFQGPVAGDFPMSDKTGPNEWTVRGIDAERTIVPSIEVGSIQFVNGDSFLGFDDSEGLHLFGMHGQLIRTLRRPNPAPEPGGE